MVWTETLEVDIEGMTRTHASSNWYIQGLWTLHLLLLIFFKHTWGEGLWWSTSPRAPPYKTIRRLAWLGTSQAKTYVNGYWSNWTRHFHIDYKRVFLLLPCNFKVSFKLWWEEMYFWSCKRPLNTTTFQYEAILNTFLQRNAGYYSGLFNTLKKILKDYCHNT